MKRKHIRLEEKLASACGVLECQRPVLARGLCRRHYRKWQKYGDAMAGRTRAYNRVAVDQFLAVAVAYRGEDCLLWPFARNKQGYGAVRVGGKHYVASRYICEQVRGAPVETGLEAAHGCGNGHLGCVSPLHLRWATRRENIDEALKHGRRLFGEKTPQAILTRVNVLEIVRKIERGVTSRVIAAEFGVSLSAIKGIRRGDNWAWLTGRRAP